MTAITDDYMREMMTKVGTYSVIILHPTERIAEPGAQAIVWEHGRRNFELRAAGTLAIVCPVRDGSNVCGIGIFNTDLDETKRIMDTDPGVQAGIFTYEIHPCRGFPGDAL